MVTYQQVTPTIEILENCLNITIDEQMIKTRLDLGEFTTLNFLDILTRVKYLLVNRDENGVETLTQALLENDGQPYTQYNLLKTWLLSGGKS